ncbi:hypothetical protein K2173_028252 [Erythroxylum novogranatense]|uniref:Mediator of RNA polymerase II transcription subunit 25 n=1 Tax=Erythroxylum novogranatense TaxID=1862640 RepID=A0AAV8U3Z3_9ROSI|nr:hypothetical protein K2173_028252 [Erythroxylum novogranatense]
MGPKRLMIVVDGSSEMGPHWSAILDGYLQKIVRSFCGSKVENQGTSVPELSYVQSHRGPLSEGPGTLPSGRTTDVDVYLNWLSNLTFDVSCDINSFAIGDCLAYALLEMFGMKHNDDHDQYGGERHCILVAASNPFGSTDLQRTGSCIGTKRKRTDAESMAEYCRKVQLDVSLSVISPIDIPIFKKIYYAVNANILFRIIMQANPNSPAKNFKSNLNPDFVVLLSEKFVLACDALKEEEPTKNNLSERKSSKFQIADLPPLSYDPSQFLSTSIPCLLTFSEDFIFQEMNSFGSTDESWLPELEPIVSLSDPLIVSPWVMVSPHSKALPLKDSMGGTQRNVVEYQTQKTSMEHQTENETTFRQVVDSSGPHFAHEIPQNQNNRPLSTSNSSASVMKMPSQSSALIQRKGKRKQVSHQREESASPVTPPTMPSRMLPGKPGSLLNDLFGNLENIRSIGLQEMHSTHGLATPSAVHQSEPSAGSLNTISTGSSSSSSGQTGQSITAQHFAKIQCPTGQGNFPGAHPAKEGSSHNWSPMTSYFLSKLMSDIGMSAPMRQMHPILPRRIESASAFGKQMPPEVDEAMRSFFARDGQHFNLQEHNRYVKAWEVSPHKAYAFF